MSDSYREQRPLLNDDFSDEDFHIKSVNYKRRHQPFVCSGRARNYAKGAAAVITRWPDNCSTSVAYWWLGVSMIAIITFVIYNSILIFGMIPTSDLKQPKYRTFNTEIKTRIETLSVPDVFMHLVINNSTNIRVNKYLPHVRALSNKYPNFKYTFLLVLNDTSSDVHDFSDEMRNEMAFNSLWINENLNRKISRKYNISVEYVSLTAYLSDSPIKKFWRHLPPHFIEFLLRSVSIWEKGGIAFNPVIFISKSSGSNYVEKLYELFKRYTSSNVQPTDEKVTAKVYSNTRRPNNIQDIINALDNKDSKEIDLSEAENNDVTILANTNILQSKLNKKRSTNIANNSVHNLKENKSIHTGDTRPRENNYSISNVVNSTTETILPLFLKYLFGNIPKKDVIANTPDLIDFKMPDSNEIKSDSFISRNNSVPVEEVRNISKEHVDFTHTHTVSKNLNTRRPHEMFSKYEIISELSMDLKGNIIASKIPCHAFLGTMFSNVFQHTEEETLTDLIISELSMFCNGLLTSCAGVNVILV